MNKPESTTQEIEKRYLNDDLLMSEGSLIEIDTDDYFQFVGILLDRLEVRERTSQFHKSNHLAAEKQIEELEAQLNFDTTDDGGTMERILRRRVKKLEAQMEIVKKFDEDPLNIDLDVHSEEYKDGWYDCIQELQAIINKENANG